MVVGFTYDCFNYTRTGAANTVRVGEINFDSTRKIISLTNVSVHQEFTKVSRTWNNGTFIPTA